MRCCLARKGPRDCVYVEVAATATADQHTQLHPTTRTHPPTHTHTKLPQEWAAEEAESRLARIEDGKEVEYGRIYHKQLLTGGFVEHSAVNADNPPEELEGEEDDE